MKLSYILSQARSGELASLSKKDKSDHVIINYLNMAIQALYNKFVLDSGEAIITLDKVNNRTLYTMDSSDTAVINAVTQLPMTDYEYMVPYQVTDENGYVYDINNQQYGKPGYKHTLDDNSMVYTVFTVGYNQIQVPQLDRSDYLSVVYRKNPELVVFTDDGNGNAVDTEVKLPPQLIEPALHFIGYRAHGAVNGNVQAENNTHYTRFLRSIQEIERLGLLPTTGPDSAAVQTKGFI